VAFLAHDDPEAEPEIVAAAFADFIAALGEG
jgi:hypothetical protein